MKFWLTTGTTNHPAVYYNTSVYSTSDVFRVTMVLDAALAGLATGRHYVTANFEAFGNGGVSQITGSEIIPVDVVNWAESAYGRGRWIEGLDRIYRRQFPNSNPGALLVRSDGSTAWFPESAGTYTSPSGQFEQLAVVTPVDVPVYKLTHADGSYDYFGLDGKLQSQRDRHLQTTTYTYNPDGTLASKRNKDGELTTYAYTTVQP